MTVTPLVEHLRRDADAEAARRVDEARAAAAHMAAEVELHLTSTRATSLEAARQAVARETDARRDAARMRGNEVTLVARQRFVTRVLGAASVRAPERAGDRALAAWLARNLDAALRCLPPGPAIVRASTALIPIVESFVRRDGSLELCEDDALTPGVVVETADGALRVDATLAALLHAERPRLAIWLLREAAMGTDS